MHMIIRKMELSDVPQVAAIEQVTFSQPWSIQGFRDALSNPNTLFLVAQEDEENPIAVKHIAGYVGMYLAMGEGEITNVAVAEAFRRKGVGSLLMTELKKRAVEQEIGRIILEVRVSNAPAIGLYEQLGFCKVGTRKGFYSFPTEDADIMIWEYNNKE